ncbi:pyrroline-5-carboxylate reductase [Herbaspirillum sp. YR522]|uniref:pyrroline-5-carboxylate reductase n=1 Tax=Herbaspirillum sp. YR522 TaxID=1144342 RepID=UPI00026F531D|nr:pyrroline-5-carboxylate reductase [Herbaspirillum sp. YR522]EJN10339.1 pyrroline-5-carboxylate reductase [Herbaspirillum sp. YR522]
MKIAFIGAGNMAGALIGGLVAQGNDPLDIVAIDPGADARERVAVHGVRTGVAADATTLASCEVIVLAVKPQILRAVAGQLAPWLQRQLVISVAAGIRLQDLSRWLGGYRHLVRAMPNTPAQIGLGATGLAALDEVSAHQKALATAVMDAVGMTVWVEQENQLDAVTAVSGSGPAYVFYFIEAMAEAGVQMGLGPAQAQALALATFNGAAQLASQAGETPEILRERVTSKGGTTAAALASFAHAQVKQRIIDGAIAAKLRATEIGNEMGAL